MPPIRTLRSPADAIGRYLKQAKPRFVLLVGGDSHDYHNYLGLASQSFIPTRYAQTDALVTYAPADGWYVDYNNDGKPQAALGRLPVRTVAELTQLVAKLDELRPTDPCGAQRWPLGRRSSVRRHQ